MPEISDEQVRTTRKSLWRQRVAWLLILGVTALIVYANSNADRIEDSTLLRKATTRFRAMTLIGTVSLQRSLATESKLTTSEWLTAIRQIEQEARTPEEKLVAAIIAGEVLGQEPALTALADISAEGDTELAADIATVRTIYAHGQNTLPPAEQDRLTRRHGDFGKIALAFGVDAGAEPRKSIEAASRRSLVVGSVVVLGMLIFGAASIAMCVAAAVLRHRNRMLRAYTAGRLTDGTFVEAFALYLVSVSGIGMLLRLFGFQRLAWNWLLLLLVALLLLWMARRTGSVQQVLHAAGLHRGRGWWREMGAGLVGYVAGLAVIVPGLLIAYWLIQTSGAGTGHPIMMPLLTGDRWQILGFYGIACIVAPLTEETMFRGILFHHLRGRWSWASSSVLISLLFAIIHPQGWAAVPALGAIALVLAAIREWRGSLIASISAHAFNNFLSLTFALLLLRD